MKKEMNILFHFKGKKETDTNLPHILNLNLLSLPNPIPAPITHPIANMLIKRGRGEDEESYTNQIQIEPFVMSSYDRFAHSVPIYPAQINFPSNDNLHPNFQRPLAIQEYEVPIMASLSPNYSLQKMRHYNTCFMKLLMEKCFWLESNV